MKTVLTIEESKFLINGKKTYTEIPKCQEKYHGLLMNARFIQGVFKDTEDEGRFNRFERTFDPERNTDEMIASLPEWYRHGLRAITVGLQGGGPCFTVDSKTIHNNPFRPDGRSIAPDYLRRMKRIIDAADEIGMVVIVSCYYGPQSRFMKDDRAVMEGIKTACNWLRDEGFTNVIFEVANEHDIDAYKVHPVLYNDSGIVELIEIAKRESGGIPVGCSSTGAYFSPEITNASDVVLIHGNNMSRQIFYNQIMQVKNLQPNRPIICNEDSQALSNMQVALDEGVSWGYYNNLTKQEPPAIWSITEGEDAFFAARLSYTLGIAPIEIAPQDQYYIQGLKKNESFEGKRWIRLASVWPERIHQVRFYRNGEFVHRAYDDPFTINFLFNWIQLPLEGIQPGELWKAVIELRDGTEIVKETIAE